VSGEDGEALSRRSAGGKDVGCSAGGAQAARTAGCSVGGMSSEDSKNSVGSVSWLAGSGRLSYIGAVSI